MPYAYMQYQQDRSFQVAAAARAGFDSAARLAQSAHQLAARYCQLVPHSICSIASAFTPWDLQMLPI
jgi:hypothetical protein